MRLLGIRMYMYFNKCIYVYKCMHVYSSEVMKNMTYKLSTFVLSGWIHFNWGTTRQTTNIYKTFFFGLAKKVTSKTLFVVFKTLEKNILLKYGFFTWYERQQKTL